MKIKTCQLVSLLLFSIGLSVQGNDAALFSNHNAQFTVTADPLIKRYINALYRGACDADQIYLLTRPHALFCEQEKDKPPFYFGTGFVGPRFQVSETETGVCITYSTYLLIHEAHLDYLLEHPEVIVFDELHLDNEQINAELQSQKLMPLQPIYTRYLTAIPDDASIFVEVATSDYCKTPSSFVRNENAEGACYIISAFLGELLFRQAQQEHLLPGACDDMIYLCRIFNNPSHWITMRKDAIAFFDEHKNNPLNGSFLSDTQMKALFNDFLEKGLLAGLHDAYDMQIYVDISGFMTGAHKHTILVFKSEEEQQCCFIISSFLMHLLSKAQAKPLFAELSAAVIENSFA